MLSTLSEKSVPKLFLASLEGFSVYAASALCLNKYYLSSWVNNVCIYTFPSGSME